MGRESGISATKPVFPTYLLPSIKFPFPRRHQQGQHRRRHSSSASSTLSDDLSPSTAETTPNNSPPDRNHHYPTPVKPETTASTTPSYDRRVSKLSRVAPDTLRCAHCSSDLAFTSQIISKGFTGRYGRAFLVAPGAVPVSTSSPPSLPSQQQQQQQQSLLNIRVGRNENRQLVTGWHTVADISCGTCSTKLGWKYVDAKEQSQKYKVGKFILETERVMTYRNWEDVGGDGGDADAAVTDVLESLREGMLVHDRGDANEADRGDIVFDSEDEDECEDIFAGVWDPETVARRRSRQIARRKDVIE